MTRRKKETRREMERMIGREVSFRGGDCEEEWVALASRKGLAVEEEVAAERGEKERREEKERPRKKKIGS